MKNVQDSEGCKISLISFGTEKSKKNRHLKEKCGWENMKLLVVVSAAQATCEKTYKFPSNIKIALERGYVPAGKSSRN